MKNLLIVVVMLIAADAFAQAEEISTGFDALKEFFLPAIFGSISALALDAAKHMFKPEWSFSVFFGSKLKPFVYSVGGAVALYYIFAYVPFLQPYLELFAGQELVEFNAATLIGFATALIDGIMKRFKKDPEVDTAP